MYVCMYVCMYVSLSVSLSLSLSLNIYICIYVSGSLRVTSLETEAGRLMNYGVEIYIYISTYICMHIPRHIYIYMPRVYM